MDGENPVVAFLRGEHFSLKRGGNKTIGEIFITKGLNNPSLSGALQQLIYNENTEQVEKTQLTQTQLAAAGYELDHYFERQFMSALFVRAAGQNDPVLSDMVQLSSLANNPGNLVWISKTMHILKSQFFSLGGDKMAPGVSAYLNAVVPFFKAEVDAFQGTNYTALTIAAIKVTPWYLGAWGAYADNPWFDAL